MELGVNTDTNTQNIQYIGKLEFIFIWINPYATFDAQFIKKLSNNEAELESACNWTNIFLLWSFYRTISPRSWGLYCNKARPVTPKLPIPAL